MNCEVCQLKELEVESFEIREVLSCVLHTIVFHRALGLIRPKDIDLELFDITYVQCGEIEVEKKIDDRIEHFITWIEKHPNKKTHQLCLSFYKAKSKQPWYASKTDRSFWERWYINLNVLLPPTRSPVGNSKLVLDLGDTSEARSSRRKLLEQSLQEVLFQIIKFVNDKKDHVPPINDDREIYCPFEISITSSSDSSSFGKDMWKRMLHSGHPSMIS
ncbi:Autophagy-related protein 101 [Hirschfeldia incana]|nr:Autophagy-related protein 101 [Hirschfeldia incana]